MRDHHAGGERPSAPGPDGPETVARSAIRSICVYCGSSPGDRARFAEVAAALGSAMAASGIGLVYGGGDVGLMGITARAVLDGGGHVTGIIPDFLRRRENMLDDAQELIVVPDMHTRKRLMFEKADAFVAMPGGIGTLEELVEQMTWAQLGRHAKPILILDVDGFWKPLLTLLSHMRQHGFIRPGLEPVYLVTDRVEDVIPSLRAAARPGDDPREGFVKDHF